MPCALCASRAGWLYAAALRRFSGPRVHCAAAAGARSGQGGEKRGASRSAAVPRTCAGARGCGALGMPRHHPAVAAVHATALRRAARSAAAAPVAHALHSSALLRCVAIYASLLAALRSLLLPPPYHTDALAPCHARCVRRAQNGFTPLHCAAVQGHESIVTLLLDCGADKEATDEVRRAALPCRTCAGARGCGALGMPQHDSTRPPLQLKSNWRCAALRTLPPRHRLHMHRI